MCIERPNILYYYYHHHNPKGGTMRVDKSVASIASKLKLKSSSLTVLQKAKVEKGYAYMTNLDTSVIIQVGCETDEGYLDPVLYGKTGKLQISMTSFEEGMGPEEFPVIPSGEVKAVIPACLFKKSLKSIAGFTSKDETRACLCGVHFRKDKQWISATDGHIMMIDRIGELPCLQTVPPIPEDFILSTEAIDVLGVFGFEVQSARIIGRPTVEKLPIEAPPVESEETPPGEGEDGPKEGAEEEPKESVEEAPQYVSSGSYIHFKGDGWELLSKLIEGPYPDIARLFPKRQGKVRYDETKRDALLSAIDAVLPIANPKTHSIKLDDKGFVKVSNSNLGKSWKRKVGGKIVSSHIPEIGFNALKLKQVLAAMNDEGFAMNYGKSEISGVMLDQRNRSTLIMPLRIIKDEGSEEVVDEYTEI